ncbi:hypothetical protein ACG873_30630 [Mesorhizobium sp. AaZ16]|uniref:hypothetical protein n=1 Tax=Mesorhizobium sp. AaZ16 TaxID=3402289 RepID=UPI00374E3D02
MQNDQTPPEMRAPRLVRILSIVPFLLGPLPVFAILFGHQYLPAPAWVSLIGPFAWIAGALSAVLFFWLIQGDSSIHEKYGPLARLTLIVFTPIMGLWMGYTAVTMGGPMIIAILAGQEEELTFTVTEATRWGDRKCRNPIEIDGMPALFDRICHLPEEFRRTLIPGVQIVVGGRGTQWGVFLENARRKE